MTIHSDHPFLPAEGDRSAPRLLRGRLVAPVTLWTSGAGDHGRAGLTVASVLVVDGAPPRVLGALDPESDLAETLQATGVGVVTLLTARDHNLADMFGFVAPAPGGPFAAAEWAQTPWGPRLAGARTWAGVVVSDVREVGYSLLVDATIAHAEIADESDLAPALALRRGRYGGFTPLS